MARGASLIVKTDLSAVSVVGESEIRSWAPAPGPEDRPPTVREARARAQAAATWVSRDAEAKRRIDAIYADVDQALFVWMRAPSAARPVIASQLRTMSQEWGDETTVLAVEPVREESPSSGPRTRKRRTGAPEDDDEEQKDEATRQEAPGFAVVALPDAMVRLLADGIDGAGVRIGAIATIWHMLARAAGATDASGTIGIVVSDPIASRLVWAWADASGLVAGGSVRLGGDSIDDAARRVAVDWLTWAAQLGVCPRRNKVWGRDAQAWSDAIGRAWQRVPSEARECDDPIGELARRAADQPAPSLSGRWCLSRVTRRPTRATRARYQLAGAALVLLLIAISSVAFRLWQKSVQWKADAAATRQELTQAVRDTWPAKMASQPLGASPRTVVEKFFADEIRDFRPFEPPPKPRPIFEEALRIATILSARVPEPLTGVPPVLLTQLSLDQERGNTLSFRVPDRQMGTELLVDLTGEGRFILWERTSQSSDPTQPNLTGSWTKETE